MTKTTGTTICTILTDLEPSLFPSLFPSPTACASKKGEHPSNVSQYLTMNSESLSSLRVTVSSPRHGETEARSLASVSLGGGGGGGKVRPLVG